MRLGLLRNHFFFSRSFFSCILPFYLRRSLLLLSFISFLFTLILLYYEELYSLCSYKARNTHRQLLSSNWLNTSFFRTELLDFLCQFKTCKTNQSWFIFVEKSDQRHKKREKRVNYWMGIGHYFQKY